MKRRPGWVRYVEEKYGAALDRHECELDIEALTATQSEIEQVKYDLVRHEAYRIDEPIVAYKGRYGGPFIIDGHTRARVLWDTGKKTIAASLFTSPDMNLCGEVHRTAVEAGGGRERPIGEVPVIDRVGRGTAEWERLRAELLAAWEAERRAAEEGRKGGP
jgi:hypothetical protein